MIGWFGLALALVTGAACLVAATPASTDEWPALAAGTWHVRATRTLANGKHESWAQDLQRCEDPSLLVKGYWGKGALGERGCQFRSRRSGAGQFTIISECRLVNGTTSIGTATVMLDGDQRFRLDVRVLENRRTLTAHEEAERIAACS